MNKATVRMPKQLDAQLLLALATCFEAFRHYRKSCVLTLLFYGVGLALLSGCVADENSTPPSAHSSSSMSSSASIPIEEPDNLSDLISSIRFEDNNLKACVLATGALTVGELTELECPSESTADYIRDSTGLEQLSALERLSLFSINASDIDISGMPRLKALELGELEAIDLSHNAALEYLNIRRLSGPRLDLSHNTKLHTIRLFSRRLEVLDLSPVSELTDLSLNILDLRIVDLANVPNLITLKLYGDHLQADALKALTQVKDLLLRVGDSSIIDLSAQQQLTHLSITSADVDTLDLSANMQLEVVEFNAATISDELKLSGFSMLNTVILNHSNIARLDLSHNPRLKKVSIDYHQNTSEDRQSPLNLSLNGSTELMNLDIRNTAINQLDVSENIALQDLSVSAGSLEEPLDLGSNKHLQKLQILGYKPDHLDLRENVALNSLNVNAGALTTLDLTKNKLLESILINARNLTCDSINAIYQLFSHLPLNQVYLKTFQGNCGIYADFPDDSLRKCILSTGLSKDELPMLEQFDCDYVSDLQGLGLFRDLRQFSLASGHYKNIDLSHLHQLESVNLEDGELHTLTLPLSASLHTLTLTGNDLSELDVSNLTGLNTLDMSGNRLQSIDLTNNSELRRLNLSDNDLLEIDLGHNHMLQELNVVRNNLTELNLENQSELLVLEASYNRLNKIGLHGKSKLVKLHVDFNSLRELDLSQNTQLEDINIAANYFDELDLQAATGLKKLNFGGNNFLCSVYDEIVYGLPHLDYEEAPACVTHYPSPSAPLRISDIRFPGQEFSDCVAATGAIWASDVEELACSFSFSRDVWGIEQLTNLKRLDLGGSYLGGIDLRRNTALSHLELFNSSIRKIDLTHNPLLLNLGLRSNYLSNLDLTGNSILEVVDLSNNALGLGLRGVSFGANSQIRELNLSGNRLTRVDLHALTKLQAVNLSHNKLQDVDFSHNIELGKADLERNPLSDTAKLYLDTLGGVEVHFDGHTN